MQNIYVYDPYGKVGKLIWYKGRAFYSYVVTYNPVSYTHLHPPETLHFCGSQGISTPGLKRAKMLIFKPLVGRYERFGLILVASD